MSGHRVAITGVGLVSPFGGDAEDFFSRLLRSESAITYLDNGDSHCPLAVPALQCRQFDPKAELGPALAHTMDRFSQLGMTAAFSAWRDAGLVVDENSDKPDFGVSWGTALGGTMTFEQGYRNLFVANQKRVSPLAVVMGMNNAAASHIAIKLGLGGACLTYSVACASSAVAIGEAFRAVRGGDATLMVVGGSDAPLSCGVIRAWEALRVLAPGSTATAHSACRPFHRNRSGLVLGEGAGALILEQWEHAQARGARIYAELVGYGTNCDHKHLVRPDCTGQVRAIEQALRDGEVAFDEVDYVNAHGTATREGDLTEIAALKTVFGDRAEAVSVSATKSMHGHMLGASSAVEAIVTALSVYRGAIAPTAFLDELDANCAGVNHVIGEPRMDAPLRVALSNSFAFGGSNAVLAFRSVAQNS
jgi:3-oxoacyl-[acyl-carrier-protein] synthase II